MLDGGHRRGPPHLEPAVSHHRVDQACHAVLEAINNEQRDEGLIVEDAVRHTLQHPSEADVGRIPEVREDRPQDTIVGGIEGQLLEALLD